MSSFSVPPRLPRSVRKETFSWGTRGNIMIGVHMHIHRHTRVDVYVYTCTHRDRHACSTHIQVPIYAHTCAHIDAYPYTFVNRHTLMRVHALTCVCTCVYIYAYIHTHIHMYIFQGYLWHFSRHVHTYKVYDFGHVTRPPALCWLICSMRLAATL